MIPGEGKPAGPVQIAMLYDSAKRACLDHGRDTDVQPSGEYNGLPMFEAESNMHVVALAGLAVSAVVPRASMILGEPKLIEFNYAPMHYLSPLRDDEAPEFWGESVAFAIEQTDSDVKALLTVDPPRFVGDDWHVFRDTDEAVNLDDPESQQRPLDDARLIASTYCNALREVVVRTVDIMSLMKPPEAD